MDGVTSAIQTQLDAKQPREHLKEFVVTVAAKTANHPHPPPNNGSNSGYKIDGIESPVIEFKSGYTYKFDQSDGSNASHSLRFYLDSDKTTEYSVNRDVNLAPGVPGAYVQIAVDDNTPTRLFYRCADVNQDLMGHYITTELSSSSVTNTEFGYLGGVTSDIQTQINTKQATITGAATTIDTEDLTVSRALISNASGKVAVSDVTSTELGYLDGVTSAIQTQIDSKHATIDSSNRLNANLVHDGTVDNTEFGN